MERLLEVKGKVMGRASYIRIKHEEERHEASWDWEKPKSQVFSATKDTDVAPRLVVLRNQILIGSASFADLVAAPP
ncbi:peptidyl-prolyl cis-trans isomerase Pin1-like [Hordeum vulgare]|nr:peptidyl-prolyl cis-trans isomerase Pin1-like [Hordeum vulgare]